MITVDIDMREFTRKAQQMGVFASDQLPFAISTTLNFGVHKAREHITSVTWPRSVKVHNTRFIYAAMGIEKSTKRHWEAALYDRLGRAQLERHAQRGIKRARGMLAVPNAARIKRTASGFKPRPKALDAKVPKRALRVIKGKGIFEGKGGRLHLLYSFAPSANIDKRFRFYEDFEAVSRTAIAREFPSNLQHAINTAFR